MSGPRQGILHQYTPKLTAFEHIPSPTTTPPQNLIIFIGGLFDGLLTVPYTSVLASYLPTTWTLAQVVLSSSYAQWGTSSLQKDVAELSSCVSYFRSIKSGKIILMGHSTGCQDVMEYLTGAGNESRAAIDGGIIQAPVSDREALTEMEEYHERCEFALKMVEAGDGDEIMPFKYSKPVYSSAPVTARRFLSLASPNHDGEDDYFSSDLTDEQLMKIFGALPARSPLCILFSGADEYVPKTVDKTKLVDKWISFVKKGSGRVDEVHSGIIDGASHNLKGNDDAIITNLLKSVVGFADGLTAHPSL